MAFNFYQMFTDEDGAIVLVAYEPTADDYAAFIHAQYPLKSAAFTSPDLLTFLEIFADCPRVHIRPVKLEDEDDEASATDIRALIIQDDIATLCEYLEGLVDDGAGCDVIRRFDFELWANDCGESCALDCDKGGNCAGDRYVGDGHAGSL
mgnify:CR=1 FL=1